MKHWPLALLLACAATQVQSASPPVPAFDPAQIKTVDEQEAAPAPWGIKASTGVDIFGRRRAANGEADLMLRSVLDLRKEWRFGDGWSATLSDRLEWLADKNGGHDVRHAFREGYLSVRMNDALYADLGRLNLRSGVAAGFNPTDWLREGAGLPQTSQNPVSQRENRLGAFMFRLQAIEDWGAAHVALIPHLSNRRESSSGRGFEWGRTNADRAAQLRFAPKLHERISLDALLYARQGRSPQFGLNATAVVTDSLIGHVEWSAGKRTGLAAPDAAAVSRLHHRAAAGVSWTAPNGAVFLLERHLATDALNRGDWTAWNAADPQIARRLGQLRSQRSGLQEPLVRDAWFVRGSASGAFGREDIDLSGFVRFNPYDRSRLWQIDGSWHASASTSWHLSLARFDGKARSEFGANPVRSLLSIRVEMAF